MAEWQDLPMGVPSVETVDEEHLSQSSATIIDWIPIIVDSKIHLIKRAGLLEHADLGTGAQIDGLHWFDRGHVVLAVSDGRVFKLTDAFGSKVELLGSTELRSNSPVSFTGDATRVVMANGSRMVHTDLTTLTTLADADAPTDVSHVTALDQYVLANDVGTGTVQFSAINDLTNWAALDFFSAESKPDEVVAIKEAYREIIVLGRETVEFWFNDGQNPFSRIQGSAQPFGTEAAQSLALVGDTWMWLDQHRRFAAMKGRQVVNVSTPYDRVIQRYRAVNDAIGYSISFEGMPLYVLNFPTAGETLVYNYIDQQWHRWGYWSSANGAYTRFRGLSYCYARDWNMHLIGDNQTGKIYRMSRDVFTDNGNPIRSMIRTGHIDHGTSNRKRSDIVRVGAKRGVGWRNEPDPQLMLRRRVNKGSQWNNERWRSLGRTGDRYPYVEWRNNGMYRTCQYELVHSANSDAAIMKAQELVEVLPT